MNRTLSSGNRLAALYNGCLEKSVPSTGKVVLPNNYGIIWHFLPAGIGH